MHKKFRIAVVDEIGNVLDRDGSRRKVNRDRRFLVTEARNKRQINSLLQLMAVEQDFDINSFIDYMQDRGAFTPNQLSLLFWKLSQHGIEYDPGDFKVVIRRDREKAQLLEMPEWKRQQLLPALSTSQKKWLADHSGSIAVTPRRGGRGQPARCSPVWPPSTPDSPSATHDRVGKQPDPQPVPLPIEPHPSRIDCFPPTGLVKPAQAEHSVNATAANARPLISRAARWFPMLRKRGSHMDRPGKLPGELISEVMNVYSYKLYVVSTVPELGQDSWTTAVFPIIQRKVLLGLFKSTVPDYNHQITAMTCNSMEEAHQVHAQVRHVVSAVAEGSGLNSSPLNKSVA